MTIRKIDENGLHIVFGQDDHNRLKLLHFSSAPWSGPGEENPWGTEPFFPVQVKATGENMPREIHGTKYSCVSPGYRLELVSFEDSRNDIGRFLTITQADSQTGLAVILHWQFYDGLPIVRCTTELINEGDRPLTVEYVSSFCLTGRDWRDEDLTLHIPFHSWCHEMTWKSFSLADLGMGQTQPEGLRRSSQYIDVSNTGNWSTKKYLPMGALQSRSGSSALFWQIEHNGSWHWEISDHDGYLYLQLSGPTEHQSHWWTTLERGMRFTSVPVSVGAVGSTPGAPMALTPEQAAVWSYPLSGGDLRECAFNLVSAMLLRIHQSGHLADLNEERFDLVREGISYYKSIRCQIRDALPFWPLGLADYEDGWVCLGLHLPQEEDCSHIDDLIALWRCGSEEQTVRLPLGLQPDQDADVRIVFPSGSPQKICCDPETGDVCVTLEEPYSARLLRIRR